MARIYLDADIPNSLETALVALGHDVTYARFEPGMSSASDGHQLLYASELAAVVISHNKSDFRLLHDAWRRWSAAWQVHVAHAGILLIPQRMPLAELASAIEDQLPGTEANELYELIRGEGCRPVPYRP